MEARERKQWITFETCEDEVLSNYDLGCDFKELKNPKKIFNKDYKEKTLLEYDIYWKRYIATFAIEELDCEFVCLHFLEIEEDVNVHFRANKNNKLYMNVNGCYYFIVEIERENSDKLTINAIEVKEKEIELVDEEFIEKFL